MFSASAGIDRGDRPDFGFGCYCLSIFDTSSRVRG